MRLHPGWGSQRAIILIRLLAERKEVKNVKSTSINRVERELVEAMTACLCLILEDLRAQYRRLVAEAERLEEAGGEARRLYERVQQLQRVDSNENGSDKPKRHNRRPRVQA